MQVFLLDELFMSIQVIDIFESLIWTERYNRAGDFELYTPINIELFQRIAKKPENVDYYIWLKDSTQQMIVEEAKITTEVESGSYMTISGRSLETILERRIIWIQTVLSGNLQDEIERLLNENVITPAIANRAIPNFIFRRSNDPRIVELTIEAQYTGDNLYDTIVAICESYKLGFQVSMEESELYGYQFVFELYFGKDRSYDQSENPYVIFSPKFENVINSNYLKTTNSFKNVALVAGEDEGLSRKTIQVGEAVGLHRREMYVDARDIRSEVDERVLTDAEYYSQLIQRGIEQLDDNNITEAFEGEIDTTQNFEYGKDFTKGDIVQMANEYGMEAKVRIIEFVRVQDTTGYQTYPTFSVVSDNNIEELRG